VSKLIDPLTRFAAEKLGVVEEKIFTQIHRKAINQVLVKEGQVNLKAIKVTCSRWSLVRSMTYSV